MLLMLLGNAGLVTVISSLVLSFGGQWEDRNVWLTYSLLPAGLALLWMATASKWLDRRMSTVIEWALRKWTDLDIRDYTTLLNLSSGFRVAEATVELGDYLVGKSLAELGLSHRGMVVLGIRRQTGDYDGAPRKDMRVELGDTVIVYGRSGDVASVCGRRTKT